MTAIRIYYYCPVRFSANDILLGTSAIQPDRRLHSINTQTIEVARTDEVILYVTVQSHSCMFMFPISVSIDDKQIDSELSQWIEYHPPGYIRRGRAHNRYVELHCEVPDEV